MFVTTSTYFLMFLIIGWSYCGYLIFINVIAILNSDNRVDQPEVVLSEFPKIIVLIPCYNEENYIEDKIGNLNRLDYADDRIEVYFLDGRSTDATRDNIISNIGNKPNWHLIETPVGGKINQINYGLRKFKGDADIIVSTDVDAMLEPDTLVKIVHTFNTNAGIAVVGANISPGDCIAIEKDYWIDQNIVRIYESIFYSSSIVVAPCYAYKAFLIDQFPEDCVADDIYVAFKANTDGYLTKYVETIKGKEIRSPQCFNDFVKHKFRKGNAYLIELLRFLYLLPYMPAQWKVIYITKLLQFVVLPWLLPFYLISTISLVLSGPGLRQMAILVHVFLFLFFVIATTIMKRGRLKYIGKDKSKDTSTDKSKDTSRLYIFILSNIMLMLIGLSYPFYKQTSNYSKIPSRYIKCQ